MNQEEFDLLIDQVMQKYGGTREPIPPKKESSGPRKVKFVMVKKPRTPPPNPPSKSSDTQAND